MNSALQKTLALIPQGSLEGYIQAVNAIPVLSAQEEKELAQHLQETGDLESARQLVLSHLRFVVHIAKSYSGYGLPQADLIQEGNIGLMKAVKRFDPSVGVRLVSFAVHWIKAEIYEYVLQNWRLVKIATTKAQRKLFFNLRKSKKHLKWFNVQEAKTIAQELGVPVSEVTEMERRLSQQDQSFDAPCQEEKNDFSPVHYLEDKSSNIAHFIENENWELYANQQLKKAIDTLDERSQHILQARWLQSNKTTLQALADHYNISPERVRQLEQSALKKLRNIIEPRLS